MTLRRILPALFASVLLAGSFAASAEAAPVRVHRAAAHRAAVHHAAPHATRASTRTTARRGGDAQNATVDQLNAQSLQRAQTGAPAQ